MEKYLKFSSEIKNITLAENLVDELSERFHLESELFGNILISLIEAVNNAILHGNKLDITKNVEIKMKVEGKFLHLTVCDQGPGFDYTNRYDPTTAENIEKPHGRGIFLMYHLADNVIFNKNGAEVELQFKIK